MKLAKTILIKSTKVYVLTLVGFIATALLSLLIENNPPVDWRTIFKDATFPYSLNTSSLEPFEPMNYTVRIDFHMHTLVSDGSLTPLQAAYWLQSSGYNVAFVSDHQSSSGYNRMREAISNTPLNDKLLIFPALEWTTCRIHMNLLNIKDDFPVCGLDTNGKVIKTPCKLYLIKNRSMARQ
jgi:hypothetical protein